MLCLSTIFYLQICSFSFSTKLAHLCSYKPKQRKITFQWCLQWYQIKFDLFVQYNNSQLCKVIKMRNFSATAKFSRNKFKNDPRFCMSCMWVLSDKWYSHCFACSRLRILLPVRSCSSGSLLYRMEDYTDNVFTIVWSMYKCI